MSHEYWKIIDSFASWVSEAKMALLRQLKNDQTVKIMNDIDAKSITSNVHFRDRGINMTRLETFVDA